MIIFKVADGALKEKIQRTRPRREIQTAPYAPNDLISLIKPKYYQLYIHHLKVSMKNKFDCIIVDLKSIEFINTIDYLQNFKYIYHTIQLIGM